MEAEKGVISPGGVGYDINCGVRLVATDLGMDEVKTRIHDLVNGLFRDVPCGVGRGGDLVLPRKEIEKVAREGAGWMVANGHGTEADIEYCEDGGCYPGADPSVVSDRAYSRGRDQLGTLGSGNHFLEIQRVDRIHNSDAAKAMGIDHEGQVTVMVHTGSRGFGHQICSDYIRLMERAVRKYNIHIPDRELACTPGKTPEAEDYFQAMASAVNYAFTNRQLVTHWTRQAFEEVFNRSADRLGLELVYDVAHNICKQEEHDIEGIRKRVWVHRKGATRAFPPEHRDLPKKYRETGQPVLIAGTMGTSSWILLGTKRAMEVSFGSTAHGAGRCMSRAAAKREFGGFDVKKRLESRGVMIRAANMTVVSEEAPQAYKDVDRVAEVSDKLGIATKVARLTPLGCVKG